MGYISSGINFHGLWGTAEIHAIFFEEDNENERLQYKTRDSAFNKLL